MAVKDLPMALAAASSAYTPLPPLESTARQIAVTGRSSSRCASGRERTSSSPGSARRVRTARGIGVSVPCGVASRPVGHGDRHSAARQDLLAQYQRLLAALGARARKASSSVRP